MSFLEDIFTELPFIRMEGVPAALEEPAIVSCSAFFIAIPSEFLSVGRDFKFALARVNSLVGRKSPMDLILDWRRGTWAVRRF